MIQLIHIPKTGGTALAHALHGVAHHNGHSVTLSTLRRPGPVITIVRDPVARFVSAFWWMAEHHLWPWASPDDMAAGIGSEAVDARLRDTLVFWPQSHWLDADTPLLWTGHTETLDTDVLALADLIAVPVILPTSGRERNAGRRAAPMSPAGAAAVRDFYAADYRLMEGP